MNSKLKVLGLALMVVLAMSAVVASAATAKGTFTSPAYPTTIKGSQQTSAGQLNYFEATDGNKTECTTATYQATLAGPSHELTVTPHYFECKVQPLNLNAVITLNGCHYLFTTTGTDPSGNTTGEVHVVCPEGKKIEINVGGGVCKVDIGSQTVKGITYTNKGGNTVTVDVDTTNEIKYTDTDTSIFCPFAGNSENANGDFVSSVTIEGFVDPGGKETGPTGAETTYKKGAPRNIDVG